MRQRPNQPGDQVRSRTEEPAIPHDVPLPVRGFAFARLRSLSLWDAPLRVLRRRSARGLDAAARCRTTILGRTSFASWEPVPVRRSERRSFGPRVVGGGARGARRMVRGDRGHEKASFKQLIYGTEKNRTEHLVVACSGEFCAFESLKGSASHSISNSRGGRETRVLNVQLDQTITSICKRFYTPNGWYIHQHSTHTWSRPVRYLPPTQWGAPARGKLLFAAVM